MGISFLKSAKQQVNNLERQIKQNAKKSEQIDRQATESITKGKNWSVQMAVGVASNKISETCSSMKRTVKSFIKSLFE